MASKESCYDVSDVQVSARKGRRVVSDGKVIARIPNDLFVLRATDRNDLKKYIDLPENAVQAWLTTYTWCDEELGTCVMIKADNNTVWIREKYIKLFGRAKYDLYVSLDCKTLWLTKPNTREVVGVIAGVRGINIKSAGGY